MQVIIIGAGIGGLSTAIALQRAGINVTLYERSPQLRASGAGLSLWPNATRILRQWEILDPLLALGNRIERTQLATAQGEALTGLDLSQFEDPAFCIQRTCLQKTLAERIFPPSLCTGYDLVAVQPSTDQVQVRFANGETAQGDLLIAADGIYSSVRSQFWPTATPKYQGYVAWRGVTQQTLTDWPAGMAMQYWGQGKRFGLLSMGVGRMYWFASLNSLNPEVDMHLIRKKDYLANLFQGWHAHVREAIHLTDEADLLVRPIEATPRLSAWSQGRVLLLGDAAHAMTPNLGQGACMAIEDAAALAHTLQSNANIPQALERYQRQRMPRVHGVMRRSQLLGQLGQLEHPAGVTLRAWGLRLAPDQITQISFQSLFNSRD